MHEQPIVLLLEDSPITAFVLEQAILVHLPHCRPIWARNLEEARLRTASIPVDVPVTEARRKTASRIRHALYAAERDKKRCARTGSKAK